MSTELLCITPKSTQLDLLLSHYLQGHRVALLRIIGPTFQELLAPRAKPIAAASIPAPPSAARTLTPFDYAS